MGDENTREKIDKPYEGGRQKGKIRLTLMILSLIVPVILTVVGWIIDVKVSKKPDFELSVNPVSGVVQPGGTLVANIKVRGINGYDEEVRLLIDEKPGFVKVGVSRDHGTPNPVMECQATFHAQEDVLPGIYDILIIAEGGDGKTKKASFTLNVKTDTQEVVGKSEAEGETFNAYIDSPQDNTTVEQVTLVKGHSDGQLAKGKHAWVCIQASDVMLIWPQFEIPSGQQEWSSSFYFHEKEKYYIIIVIVDESDHTKFKEWREEGMRSGNWPGLGLPGTAAIHKKITVFCN